MLTALLTVVKIEICEAVGKCEITGYQIAQQKVLSCRFGCYEVLVTMESRANACKNQNIKHVLYGLLEKTCLAIKLSFYNRFAARVLSVTMTFMMDATKDSYHLQF